MSVAHNHSISSSKICCPQHIFEIARVYKQQNRLMERGVIVRKYLDTHTTTQVMIALKDNSTSKHKFLKMCNDEVCKFLLSGNAIHLL